jgi:cytochrome c biogenesis protein CcdA
MTLFFISFLAGVLTVLAPCILPLLPIVIGSSVNARSKATPYIVIASLGASILLFTYILKVSTVFITVPLYVWSYISGGVLIFFGLIFIFPAIWEHMPFVAKISKEANKTVGAGHQKKSFWGDVTVGAALGPVFSSCSPTYFVILATVLPASFALGTLYLLSYIAGLSLILALIALLGQKVIAKLNVAADSHGWFKRGVGLLFIIVGIFIFTGYDKKLEAWILQNGFLDNALRFEQNLLDEVEE